MKTTLLCSFKLFLAGCGLSVSAAAQFTPGNVVVYQVGDGVTTYTTGSSAPISLKEYLPATPSQISPVSLVNIPFSGAGRLVNTISANSEGFMNLSADSTKLVLAGYDTTIAFASITSTTAANVARAIDTVNASGIPGRAAATSSVFSAATFRSAVRSRSENYWAVGSNSGVYYMGNTATAAAISTAVTNLRVIGTANGNLYFATASASGTGLYKISGLPTTTATSALLISIPTGASPYGFSINASETVAYIADDRTTSANVGGIYRWVLSGSIWSATDTLKPGTAIGARGLTVDWSGTYPIVYATTTDNRLIRWVDSNTAGHIYTTLATGPANAFFRSVALAPRMNCSPPAAPINPSGKVTICAGGSVILKTNNAAGLSYTWKKNGAALTGPGTSDSALTVLTAGHYKVIVMNSGGCRDSSATDTVVMDTPIKAQIRVLTNDTLCAGERISIRTTAGAPPANYSWNVNGSIVSNSDSNLSFFLSKSPSSAYTWTVKSYILDVAGCVDSSTPVTLVMLATPAEPQIQFSGGILTVPAAYSAYQWYLNGNIISGATSNTLTPPSGGSYTVRVANAEGCDTLSTAFIYQATGVNTVLARANIRLHPNPTIDVLHIDAPDPVGIIIRDMQGRILLKHEGVKALSLKNIPAGLYTITIYDAAGGLISTELLRKSE